MTVAPTTLKEMLVARSGLSPVMVGRDAELEGLRRRFDAVTRDQLAPPVAIVSGEAGVGKTRLLRELASALEAPVLAGQAGEEAIPRPFALVRSLLEGRVAEWGGIPPELVARDHTVRHVLAPLVPEHDPADRHEHASEELARAAVDALRAAVGDTPTLVLFEDLHWADADSVDLFARLATTPGLPILLIGTFRPEDFDRHHPLARTLPGLERQRTVDHLALGRLSHDALAALLEIVYDQPVPGATVQALHARTHGNPFFVEELVACCAVDDPATLPDVELPWNAAEAVLRRVDALEPTSRRVLDTAAVLGSRVAFDILAAVTAEDEGALLTALHDLAARGLITETEPDRFSFRHALTREAVAGQLFGRERRRIHEQALAALDALGQADPVARAHHAAGAGDTVVLAHSAEEGAEQLLADGAALSAFELASLALERCDDLSPARALALHELASQAAWRMAMLADAERHALSWLDLAVELGDRSAQSAALRHLGSVRWLSGDVEGSREALDRALATAEELGSSAELAWCYSYRSQAHMLLRESDEAILWADRALELADEVGAVEVRPYTLVNKGTVLLDFAGKQEEGLALLAEARETARRLRQPKALLRAYNNALVYLLHETPGGTARAEALLAEADAAAERYGHELFSRKASGHGFQLALLAGDLDLAEAQLAGAPGGDPFYDGLRELHRTFVAAERGEVQRAGRHLARVSRGEAVFGSDQLVALTDAASVQIGVVASDGESVDAALERLARPPDATWDELQSRGNPSYLTWAVVDAAVLPETSRPAMEAVLDVARAFAVHAKPMHAALLAHAEAALAEHAGDHALAIECYHRALAVEDLPVPVCYLAEARAGLARCLAATGDRAGAVAEIIAAAGLLARWPGWRRQRIEALAARLRPADDVAGPVVLTRREREVLELVARGMSNRDIAGHLYIAQKTAAVHVSNILAKSNTHSRTEAAAWAHRQGLLEVTDA